MSRLVTLIAAILSAGAVSAAADWPRFRGPGGGGRGGSAVPLEWSDHENLLWKTPLPGPGSSSPVIHGDDVFVTCYSGYGVPGDRGGGRARARPRHARDRPAGRRPRRARRRRASPTAGSICGRAALSSAWARPSRNLFRRPPLNPSARQRLRSRDPRFPGDNP